MIKEITVKGAVQGIGYRPFIAGKAKEFNISGFVKNLGAEVRILAMGAESDIEAFISCIKRETPKGGFILDVLIREIHEASAGSFIGNYSDGFTIVKSTEIDISSDLPVFLPDIGICDDCMSEMLSSNDRRYRYPLISCAVCGPRMSILDSLPYDRVSTTMKDFEMCPECGREYNAGRRRYAQTISCHSCGPQMILRRYRGAESFNECDREEAVKAAIEILSDGGILGLKGVSGYQLLCRPEPEVSARMRRVKGREKKPFALMFSDISSIREYALVSPMEEGLLKSSPRPIVLLQKKYDFDREVVGGSRYIGAFLPSAGIHRLLTDALGPLIVTSANKSDRPMITENQTFFSEFCGKQDRDLTVDGVLYHRRRINMPQDDSVMFVINEGGEEYSQFIRRARGFVPLPVIFEAGFGKAEVGKPAKEPDPKASDIVVFGYGGDLKSCFAIGHRDKIMPSQYIGDLEGSDNLESFTGLKDKFKALFKQVPNLMVCDLHPGYMSTQLAQKEAGTESVPLEKLQHHAAHIYSVMAESSLMDCIGVSFDGTGYGTDGNIWGGEFLQVNGGSFQRAGHLSYVDLIGGDASAKDAVKVQKCYRHAALEAGYLGLPESDDPSDKILFSALDKHIQTYRCSSVGRLFDAVSSLLSICSYNSYEGECATALEKAAWEYIEKGIEGAGPEFEFEIKSTSEGILIDQVKLFSQIAEYCSMESFDREAVAYSFHRAVIEMITRTCSMIRQDASKDTVCLSGGVFNNRIILTGAIKALKEAGFKVYWNRQLPLGDGGISAGQCYWALIK